MGQDSEEVREYIGWFRRLIFAAPESVVIYTCKMSPRLAGTVDDISRSDTIGYFGLAGFHF